MTDSYKINPMQRAILQDYAEGMYASQFDGRDTITHADLISLGDPLLVFLLVELSTESECDNIAVGAGRLIVAHDDIDVCLNALAKLNQIIMDAQLAEQKAA